VAPGQLAPDFSVRTLDGDKVRLSDYRGKVVVLAFWSSWCSRCEEELAFLTTLNEALSGDLVVLALNQETDHFFPEELEAIRQKVAAWNVPFPILLDEELNVWSQYCVNALPSSVILDRKGRISFAEPNFYWASRDNITAALTELGVLRH
jgi:peroxiredoxin